MPKAPPATEASVQVADQASVAYMVAGEPRAASAWVAYLDHFFGSSAQAQISEIRKGGPGQ
jgi:hypothetical protein